ncbi:hypothetical protein HYALB_00008456 [Hymenoscyphus albidus]|uniref:ATP synthase subunit a n=1 Tax=Hymenoscyphus albidus TaxID=595503 RepID=A0A9N9LM25_9HELO|nr:hypothetical protein HYALB_00008456 [Hymenoscyphus albidus]
MTSGFIFFFLGLIPLAFIIAFSGLELGIAFIQAQVFVVLTRLIPLAFIIAFSGLELGIAFIQAQVFVVLTSSYIKYALDLH